MSIQTLNLTLASALSTSLYTEQLELLLAELDSLVNIDTVEARTQLCSALSRLLPFLRHQVGTNIPTKDVIVRILRALLRHLQASSSYGFVRFALLHTSNFLIVLYLSEGDNIDAISKDIFKGVSEHVTTHLADPHKQNDVFDHGIEASFLLPLIDLATHNTALRKVKVEVDIFKLTMMGQSRIPLDLIEDQCKTIINAAKKEKLTLPPWVVSILLLRTMHLKVFSACNDTMYNAMVLYIQDKMYAIWQVGCVGADCLKEIVLHPQPLLGGELQDRALFDSQAINLRSFADYTKSKMNLFWSPKYHNWWMRYKAYEGFVLALESKVTSKQHGSITTLLDSRTAKENKDETRVIFAARASRGSIHELLMKWSAMTLENVSLTFAFELSPESCALKNLPMLFGNMEEADDKRRIGVNILSQQSTSDLTTVERDAAVIVAVFIQGNRPKDLEVAVDLFRDTFASSSSFPVVYTMSYLNTCIQLGDVVSSKMFMSSRKAVQGMLHAFCGNVDELTRFLQQVDGLCNAKKAYTTSYKLLFGDLTPDASVVYGELIVDMTNLRPMLFEGAFSPTSNLKMLAAMARMMQVPVEVMQITQHCKHRSEVSMYEVLRSFLAKSERMQLIKIVVIKLIAEFFDVAKNAESLLARIYQAVDKFSVDDMATILTVIYEKLVAEKATSSGRHAQLGQLLNSMMDIEDFSNATTSSGKEIAKRLDASKSSADWTTALSNLQFVIFELKYPEKDIEVVEQEFLSQPVPLSADDLQKYIAIYTRMKEHFFQQNLRDVQKDALMQLIAMEVKKAQSVKGSEDFIVRALALIRQAVYISKSYYPYNTQFLVVIAMIYSPTEMKGRLGQVKTGQGKSIIVNMLASFLGMYNCCIDIVTSSESLARRDAKESRDFFALFGLTVSHCCEEDLTQSLFKPSIVYGTPFRFEWAALQDEYDLKAIRSPRPYDIVIVDEVDNMLIDRLAFSTQIIYENEIFYSMMWIYDLLYQAYKRNPGVTVEELRHEVVASKAYHYCSARIRSILDAFLKTWLPSVSRAFQMECGKNYIVLDGEIKPVDYDNTGEIQANTKYVAALHQLLEVKEGLYPSLDSLLGSHISHLSYFNRYRRVFGLTGTMGSSVERQEILEFYHLATFDVPVHVQGKREDYIPVFANSTEDWYREVAEEALREARKHRPVLILFESIKETTLFEPYLSGYNQVSLLNGVQAKDEEIVVAEAGQPGQITVATNMAGRGTDIRTWKESEANGGTHVIITFLPASFRVEEQAKGRTARQGKIGSVRFMFDRSDYPNKLKNTDDLRCNPVALLEHMQRIRSEEELAGSISRRQIFAPLSRCQDAMVTRICQRFAVWKRTYDDFLFRGARQQWVEWFTLLNLSSSAIEKNENFDAVQPFINGNEIEFQKLIARLETELANRTAIRDPLILYEKAESLQSSDPNQALLIITHLVQEDPRCSQGYYLAATIYRELKQPQLERNMWAACIQSCEINLSVNPKNINDLMLLATAYKQTNQVPKAIEIIDRFVLQFTKSGYRAVNYAQLVDVANLLRKNEMFHSALRVLEKAIPLQPDRGYGYNIRGLTLVDMERYREGIEDFQRALQVEPTFEVAATNVGWAYRRWADKCGDQQRWQEALTCINEAIKHNPNDSNYYVDRGYYYDKMSRKWEAKQDYLKALQLNPNNETAKSNLKNCD